MIFNKHNIITMVICLILATSGCSSVMYHTGPDMGYYPGTRAAAEMVANSDNGWPIRSLAAIDLPFSALLDTVLLPWDYLRRDDSSTANSP